MEKSGCSYNNPLVSNALYVTAIAAVAVMTFGNSLGNDFVWDDNIFVVGNITYKYFNIWKLFFSPLSPANGVEYLPVRDLTYAIDYMVWGENPYGFHMTNLIIYLITGVVCYFTSVEFLKYLRNNSSFESTGIDIRLASAMIAVLYVVHPIHSQVVSFIIQRNALLSGMFFFMSLYCYLRFEQSGNDRLKAVQYFLSLCFCLLAFFSKATSITLPVILLVIALLNKGSKTWMRRLCEPIPFFIMGYFAFCVHSSVARSTNVLHPDLIEFGAYNFLTKLATAVQIPYFYLYKLVFPFKLAPEYYIQFIADWHNFTVFFALFIGLAAFWCAWEIRERYPYVLFCLCWYFITLIPVLNLMPTRPVVADRYAFLPSYAFCFVFPVLLLHTAKRQNMNWLKAVYLAYLVLMATVSFRENTIWKDEKTLYSTMIQRSPDLFKGYTNLGHLYFKQKQYDKAFSLFQQAYRLDPSKPDYELEHGMLAFRANNFKEAIDYYNKALAISEQSLQANFFMGLSYLKLGDYQSSAEVLQKVLDSTEVDTNSYRYKAGVFLSVYVNPKLKPEIDVMREAVIRSPEDRNLKIRLADTLYKYGMLDESLQRYKEVSNINKKDWQILFSIAKIYRRKKDFNSAIIYLEQALALNPNEGVLFNELGKMHMALHETKKALTLFEQTSKNDHTQYTQSRYYSAVCYFQRGDKDKAEYFFGLIDKDCPEMKLKTAPYRRKLAAL